MDDFNDHKIPDNYRKIHSGLSGIDVYGPKPNKPAKRKPKSYKCPACGANTQFDTTAARIACKHCGYTSPIKPDPVGLTEAHHEFTLKTLSASNQGWGVKRKHMLCESCGAEFSITEDAITSTCPFCAANKVHISHAPVEFLRPEFIIPFKISLEKKQTLVNEWLRQGWFHPVDMVSNAMTQKFTGIYLPFWIFDVKINANWRAHLESSDETEVTGKNNSQIEYKDGWVTGQTQLEINDIPHPGTNKASHVLLENLQPFQFEELKNYSPDYLAGWQAQNYNIPLEASWATAKEKIREIAKSTIRHQINGTKIRNFSMTAKFPDETWRYVLLPVYLSAYKYKNRTFQIMVNGQTGTVAGQKPVVWTKVWLTIALLLAPGVSLGYWFFPRLWNGQVNEGILGAGIFYLEIAFLVIGGFFSLAALGYALTSESV